MNILVINQYQTAPRYSSSSRFAALARCWARDGHDVTMVSASFSHLFNTQPAMRGLVREEMEEGVRYVLLRTPAYRGNGVARVLNLVAFVGLLFTFVPRFARRQRPDVVIACSVHQLDTFPALLLSRVVGAKFVREIRDLWPMSLVELGILRKGSVPERGLDMLESFTLRNADHVVSTLPFAIRHFEKKGLPEDRFTWIPLCLDPVDPLPGRDEIPLEHARAIASHRERFPFQVGYAGSLGHGDTVDVLLDAAKQVETDGIGVVVLGDGWRKAEHEARAGAIGSRNVLFLPRVSRRECLAILSVMDALYVGWEAKPLYRFGISPNRMLDSMQVAKPIVHAITHGNDPVAESGSGVTVASGDPEALARAFRELTSASPGSRVAMGARARAHVAAHHDAATLARRYIEVMR